MLTGYNTDIKHEGIIYHVQTEDGGSENPVIVSLIYQGGRILASKKTSYAHLLGTDDLVSHLRELLEHQHKAMIKAILTGAPTIAQKKASNAPPMEQPSSPSSGPTLDQAPAHATPQPPQAQGNAAPSSLRPPLEVPPETEADTSSNTAVEKNLDQVILEYLASEIDKD
jgi:hypothetical protein